MSLCSWFELVGFSQDWDRACHKGGSKPSTPTNRLCALQAADRTGESQPSSKATTMLLATSGCLWWIMARGSAQLARKAESWVWTALRNPNPPRTKGASRHPWLRDRTVQGGLPGWCSNIATNHGRVLLRICAPSPVSQPARAMWHGHSHNVTREPRPTARPEVWESAPTESHRTGKFWPSALPQIHHGHVACPTP